jgi:hypothetical protein
MTPNELYARQDFETSYDLDLLTPCNGYSTHIPEVGDAFYGFNEQSEVSFRVYKDFDFDGRRFWRLASVWIGERPVMIIQNAGREGTDHHSRFITDETAYRNLIAICAKYRKPSYLDNNETMKDLVAPDHDIKDLTAFYGNSLDGRFDRY